MEGKWKSLNFWQKYWEDLEWKKSDKKNSVVKELYRSITYKSSVHIRSGWNQKSRGLFTGRFGIGETGHLNLHFFIYKVILDCCPSFSDDSGGKIFLKWKKFIGFYNKSFHCEKIGES